MYAVRSIAIFFVLQAVAVAAEAPAEVWSARDIGALSASLGREAEAEGIAGKTLGSFGNHSTAVWRRARSGQAELHRTRTDLLIVTAGAATIVTGGAIVSAKATSPVEVRGKSIVGGISKRIGPGDIVRVPAGTPHQFILAPGESISYFAIKIAR